MDTNRENQSRHNIEQTELKQRVIDRLFPVELFVPSEIEKKYPPRELPSGAMVTRFAPSPTGFLHIGGLYTALVAERLAHQSEGIFFLRIEDTDKKREVEGTESIILVSLKRYGIEVDEGPTLDGKEVGEYAPYKQSEREMIYKTFIKSLVQQGLAYPSFEETEELEDMRTRQTEQGERPGYYGKWTTWRDKSDEEVLKALDAGKSFVIRFRSPGNFSNKISIKDIVKGNRELSENDQDIVIMKADGLPTYHLAHVIDDHLMGTTHVIRGDEWLSSLPIHLQLFEALGWKPPKYGHVAPIQKIEDGSRRKLSKRKDQEADITYYDDNGYPREAVREYLLNLANSSFEDWRKANPNKDNREFIFSLDRLAQASGALLDFDKLNDISKEVIARYSADEVYIEGLDWFKKHDQEFSKIMERDPDYVRGIVGIERGGLGKVRKDLSRWSDLKEATRYFFDDQFNITSREAVEKFIGVNEEDVRLIIDAFIKLYDDKDSQEEWFGKVKQLAKESGFADNTKAFKKDPGQFKGSIADFANIFRVLLTGKTITPDLYLIMKVMGKERVLRRLSLLGSD